MTSAIDQCSEYIGFVTANPPGHYQGIFLLREKFTRTPMNRAYQREILALPTSNRNNTINYQRSIFKFKNPVVALPWP
jgi:hypothetical protein